MKLLTGADATVARSNDCKPTESTSERVLISTDDFQFSVVTCFSVFAVEGIHLL